MKLCNCGKQVTAKDKRNKDGLQKKCNICYNGIRNKRYKENPNPIKQRQKKYNNYQAKKQKEHARLITDTYVIAELKRGTTLTTKDIIKFPELIETKRQIIKNKRLCQSKT